MNEMIVIGGFVVKRISTELISSPCMAEDMGLAMEDLGLDEDTLPEEFEEYYKYYQVWSGGEKVMEFLVITALKKTLIYGDKKIADDAMKAIMEYIS